MKITKIYNRNRRDFTFDAKCEHCGHKAFGARGYDDDNFHNNVVPKMECPSCDKTSSEVGERPTPRYPRDLTV